MNLPYEDNFDNSATEANYNRSLYSDGETWRFVDGVASCKWGGFMMIKINAKDFVLDVDFNHAGDGGVMVRGNGDTIGYYGAPEGMVYIYRPVIISYGVKQPMGDTYWISYAPQVQGSWIRDVNEHKEISGTPGNVHIRILVQDDTYTAYANGAEMVTFTDTEGRYGGDDNRWVALYYNSGVEGQSFDNLRITPIN